MLDKRYCVIKLVPQCAKCGSPVSDLVEPEIHYISYINSMWICDECSQFRQVKDYDNYNGSEKID